MTYVNLIDMVYPPGALYISNKSTSPASLFGGNWEQIINKFIRAANDTGTGGQDEVALTTSHLPSHTHTTSNHSHSIGNHTHGMAHQHTPGMYNTGKEVAGYGPLNHGDAVERNNIMITGGTKYMGWATNSSTGSGGGTSNNSNITSGPAGSGSKFSNFPRYRKVYAWRRVS